MTLKSFLVPIEICFRGKIFLIGNIEVQFSILWCIGCGDG